MNFLLNYWQVKIIRFGFFKLYENQIKYFVYQLNKHESKMY